MSKFAAIILAAGKGTRMKSNKHKVLHEIAGRPMVNYVVDTVSHLKPSKIVTVIADDMQEVEKAVTSQYERVEFAIQKKQLGTGDAVKSALPKLKGFKGVVMVMYGDTPLISERTIKNMIDLVNSSMKPAVVVLGFTSPDPAEYGRLLVNNRGELEGIIEYKDATPEERKINLCNSGVMAVKGELLPKLIKAIDNRNLKKEYYLTDIVSIARDMGHTCSTIRVEEEEVMGINSRGHLAVAEFVVQSRLRQTAMQHMGVTLVDPDTVFFSYDTRIGKDVIVHPFVTFGKGVEISDNVEIKSFSHIAGAKISKNCIVGPYARLRPGAELSEDVHIGNFVEIKKSKIGKGSKVNHLSYVGDSEVGKDANIGAGTITCNYDGKKKHKTTIGDRAFIGSNTALVAPVKVGADAVIGAGATIIKDVPRGAKVINKMPQKEIKKKKI